MKRGKGGDHQQGDSRRRRGVGEDDHQHQERTSKRYAVSVNNSEQSTARNVPLAHPNASQIMCQGAVVNNTVGSSASNNATSLQPSSSSSSSIAPGATSKISADQLQQLQALLLAMNQPQPQQQQQQESQPQQQQQFVYSSNEDDRKPAARASSDSAASMSGSSGGDVQQRSVGAAAATNFVGPQQQTGFALDNPTNYYYAATPQQIDSTTSTSTGIDSNLLALQLIQQLMSQHGPAPPPQQVQFSANATNPLEQLGDIFPHQQVQQQQQNFFSLSPADLAVLSLILSQQQQSAMSSKAQQQQPPPSLQQNQQEQPTANASLAILNALLQPQQPQPPQQMVSLPNAVDFFRNPMMAQVLAYLILQAPQPQPQQEQPLQDTASIAALQQRLQLLQQQQPQGPGNVTSGSQTGDPTQAELAAQLLQTLLARQQQQQQQQQQQMAQQQHNGFLLQNAQSTSISSSLSSSNEKATPDRNTSESSSSSSNRADKFQSKVGSAIAYLPLNEPGPHTRFDVALKTDKKHLTKFQALVRQQMEFFISTKEDVDYSVQGRKRRPRLGQVGLRCKHCVNLSLQQRGRGAVYYPTKLNAVYQAAQNMATNHLQTFCSRIPMELRQKLVSLQDRRETASGCKQYWVDACRAVGLAETADDLRFVRIEPPARPPPAPPQQQQTMEQQSDSAAEPSSWAIDGAQESSDTNNNNNNNDAAAQPLSTRTDGAQESSGTNNNSSSNEQKSSSEPDDHEEKDEGAKVNVLVPSARSH